MGPVRATVSVCSVVAFGLLAVACGTESTNGGTSNSPVRINELMSDNKGMVEDPADQTAPDWIELYNMSDVDTDLSGYFMSDDDTNLTKYVFPAGSVIAKYGYLLLWADGADNSYQSSAGAYHVGFKLSNEGDRAILTDPDGNVVDRVEIPVAVENVAYARFPDGTGPFVSCATETHGATNGSACGML